MIIYLINVILSNLYNAYSNEGITEIMTFVSQMNNRLGALPFGKKKLTGSK